MSNEKTNWREILRKDCGKITRGSLRRKIRFLREQEKRGEKFIGIPLDSIGEWFALKGGAKHSFYGGGERPKPKCKLIGEDGNVFNIISLVSKALKQAGLPIKAEEFQQKAFNCKSYDEVLMLCMEYVEVE